MYEKHIHNTGLDERPERLTNRQEEENHTYNRPLMELFVKASTPWGTRGGLNSSPPFSSYVNAYRPSRESLAVRRSRFSPLSSFISFFLNMRCSAVQSGWWYRKQTAIGRPFPYSYVSYCYSTLNLGTTSSSCISPIISLASDVSFYSPWFFRVNRARFCDLPFSYHPSSLAAWTLLSPLSFGNQTWASLYALTQ